MFYGSIAIVTVVSRVTHDCYTMYVDFKRLKPSLIYCGLYSPGFKLIAQAIHVNAHEICSYF